MKIIEYVDKKLGSVISTSFNYLLDFTGFDKRLAETNIEMSKIKKGSDAVYKKISTKKVLDDISFLADENAELPPKNTDFSDKIDKIIEEHKKHIAIGTALALGIGAVALYGLSKEKPKISAAVSEIEMSGYKLKEYPDGKIKCEVQADANDISVSGGVWKKYPEWKVRTPIGDNDIVFKFNPVDGTPFVAYMGLTDLNWKEKYFKAKLVVDEDFIKANGNNVNIQGNTVPVDFKKIDERGIFEGELKIPFSEKTKDRFLKYHEELPGVIIQGGEFPANIDIEYSPSDLWDYLFNF